MAIQMQSKATSHISRRGRYNPFTTERDTYLAEEPPAMRHAVTLSVTKVSLLDTVDSVVKAHGQLHWNVTYRLHSDILGIQVRQPPGSRNGALA